MQRHAIVIAGAFCLGSICGAAVVRQYDVTTERWRKERTYAFCRERIPWLVTNYYSGHVRTPIPRNLDLTTNSWRQLVYWSLFAREYALADTSPSESKETNTPAIASGAAILSADDPWVVESHQRYLGKMLGIEAARLARGGTSFDDLRAWVETNWYYDDAAAKDWARLGADPHKGREGTGREQ